MTKLPSPNLIQLCPRKHSNILNMFSIFQSHFAAHWRKSQRDYQNLRLDLVRETQWRTSKRSLWIWNLKPSFATEVKGFLQLLLSWKKRLLEEYKCKSFSLCHFFVMEKSNFSLRIGKGNSNVQEVYDFLPLKAPLLKSHLLKLNRQIENRSIKSSDISGDSLMVLQHTKLHAFAFHIGARK